MPRPLAVTIIGWLMVAVGAIGFVYHLMQMDRRHPYDDALVLLVELVALTCGVFLLRGKDWARWLTLAWMAFHVAISFGSVGQVTVHGAILAVLAFFLLRADARHYFRGVRTGTPVC